MNRYRNAPGLRGPTKATASTLCQKCLKRGHYSYECKVTAQERPYLARPSRTQQLLNPKLRPQLTTDVPDDSVRTKGIANALLAQREAERGRKRDLHELETLDNRGQAAKRTRSLSSASTSSVSTISTNRHRSISPRQERYVKRREERSLTHEETDADRSYAKPYTSRSQPKASYHEWGGVERNHAQPPPRQRSLSPYSKRIALTQAMNMGH
ncbi:zinc knuckle-domain-containing protein [Aspergillus nidulans var. acristatus]